MRISISYYTAELLVTLLEKAIQSDLGDNDRKRLYLLSCKISDKLEDKAAPQEPQRD